MPAAPISIRRKAAKPFRDNVLDINGLAALRGIAETDTHWVVGARTTWTDLVRHPLPAAFDALKQAAREVGSVQIQNVASIAGNLCNASPAADGVPGLLVLDAEVELRSAAATRHLPLPDFILGNRRTALAARRDGHRHPHPETRCCRHLGLRQARRAALSRHLHRHGGGAPVRRERHRRGSGHCRRLLLGGRQAARRRRSRACVASLRTVRSPLRSLSAPMAELSPIDDVRGSAEYRRDAAREIVARAVLGALDARPVAA